MANSSLCHRGSFGQRVPHSDEPYKACKGRPLQVDIGDLPDVTEAGARQRIFKLEAKSTGKVGATKSIFSETMHVSI
jgi:hypothetical protein